MLRKINAERTLIRLRDINGAPLDMLNTEDEMAALDAAEQQATAAQQMLEAAPIAANTIKTLADAEATAGAAKF